MSDRLQELEERICAGKRLSPREREEFVVGTRLAASEQMRERIMRTLDKQEQQTLAEGGLMGRASMNSNAASQALNKASVAVSHVPLWPQPE